VCAILVGCRLRGETRDEVEESLDELAQLLETAGGVEVARVLVEAQRPVPATFIGKGSVERLTELIVAQEIPLRTVVFDVDLTPGQQRNLEEAFDVMVMDRTGLILDIFAKRAQTAEGKLQVQLAQLNYLLPRLRGMWTHLSRQGAGIGTRGPGETDLEVDRRRIHQQIATLKRRLEKVRTNRAAQRKQRCKHGVPTVALVGYTNAGKSTLLRALTDADVFIENQLFATLDTTARELRLPGNVRAIVIDTVGFIRKLPHHLVESFKATFEEVTLADVLVHVIDASHPQMDEQIQAVQQVLDEMGVQKRQVLTVFNKIDRLDDRAWLGRALAAHRPGVAISAMTGDNLAELLDQLSMQLSEHRRLVVCAIPLYRVDLIHKIRSETQIVYERVEEERIVFQARMETALAEYLNDFQTEEELT